MSEAHESMAGPDVRRGGLRLCRADPLRAAYFLSGVNALA